MIVLVIAAIVGGALTATQYLSWGLAWTLLLGPIGGSLAAALAALLIAVQPFSLRLKLWPWGTKL